MPPEHYIDAAIERGAQGGHGALDDGQASVFLISEAEDLCDMEGIDSFIDKYGPAGVLKCAEAYRSIGATEIGEAMGSIAASLPDCDDALWSRTNDLITDRSGYDYEAIRLMVASRLT